MWKNFYETIYVISGQGDHKLKRHRVYDDPDRMMWVQPAP